MNHNHETIPSDSDSSPEAEAAHRLVDADIDERLIALSKSMRQREQDQGIRIPVHIETPQQPQAKLDAAQAEFGRNFDRIEKQGQKIDSQIREDLAREGLRPVPTVEDIDEPELTEISKRDAANEAAKLHQPKVKKSKRKPPTHYASPRDTGPPLNVVRDIRGE